MTTTWTTVEERIVWTATEDPSYQFVTLRPTSVTLSGGGGGGSGLELGETSSTAYRGDRGKTAYDHSQVVTGNPHGTTAGDITSGTFDAARIPDLDAAKITTGTVAQARLGSGSAGAGTKFLADDQTYKTASAAIAQFYGDDIYSGLQAVAHATIGGGGTGVAYGANLLVLWRILPVQDLTVDGLIFQVQVDGGSGALARCGIYAQDSATAPVGAPLVQSADLNVNVAASTQVSASVTPTALTAWTPYWGALVFNSGTTQIRYMANGANNVARISSIDAGQSSNANHTLRRVAHTFGALPTNPGAAFTAAVSDIPGVLWKVQV